MSISQPPVPRVLPTTAAERVRDLANYHPSGCRHCRQGLVCSIAFDLRANADRLERKEAEMAARRKGMEISR